MRENIKLRGLRTCGLENAMGVDVAPVFAWVPQVERGTAPLGGGQSAYQILLTDRDGATLWDSGKVRTERCWGAYTGGPLGSSTTYFWRVRIWDEADRPCPWSAEASFTTGVLGREAWQARWIDGGPRHPVECRVAPIFRRRFAVEPGLVSAVLHICGLGLYTLELNGRSVDDTLLNPVNTQFDVRALYRTYCVAAHLAEGENTVTVELGNGFYNEDGGVWNWQTAAWRASPRLLFQLELRYADGHRVQVCSDESWQCTLDGPIRRNSIYTGEVWDGRYTQEKAVWYPACLARAPEIQLSAQLMEPIRRLDTYGPAAVEQLAEGNYLITAPEMMTGWAKLHLCAGRGEEITVLYGEKLDGAGHVARNGGGEGAGATWWQDCIQCDTFISGGTPADFEPRYSYKGFRYIELTGYRGRLTAGDVALYRVGNDVVHSGRLDCGDRRVMELHGMMCRTLRNNFQGKPTDTPVLEKNGWLGDANVALCSMLYNYDLQALLREFLRTMADCLHLYGQIPVMVPTANWFTEHMPLWNSVFVFAAQELWRRYDDTALLEALYPDLAAYTERNIRISRQNGWLWGEHYLDDWVSPLGRQDAPYFERSSEGSAICVTAFVYRGVEAMADIARALGREEEAAGFAEAASHMKGAFHRSYYRREEALYDTGVWSDHGGRARYRTRYRQTSNLLALAFGLVPPSQRQRVFERLCRDIEEKDFHLDTGCIGTPFLLPVLADMGREDLAYRILWQNTYPSWGFWISQGADTMWEMWESTSRSRDHYFLGTCEEFFYSHIVGLRDIRDGWRHFTVKPGMLPYIPSAAARLETVRGTVAVRWERRETGLHMELTVPFGAEAAVVLPGGKWRVVAGADVALSPCGDAVRTVLCAGEYVFDSEA